MNPDLSIQPLNTFLTHVIPFVSVQTIVANTGGVVK